MVIATPGLESLPGNVTNLGIMVRRGHVQIPSRGVRADSRESLDSRQPHLAVWVAEDDLSEHLDGVPVADRAQRLDCMDPN